MDYGLWNLHGGFWASNNPNSGDSVSRSLYSTVGAGSTGYFHGCAGEERAWDFLLADLPFFSVLLRSGMHLASNLYVSCMLLFFCTYT
jgi:hypothetical protein